MKRLSFPLVSVTKKKKKRLQCDVARRPDEIYARILAEMSKTWFHIREMIDHFGDIPQDIGFVIMSLYCTYSCGECHTPVTIRDISLASICVACYNFDNASFGILCDSCGPYVLEECGSCRYSQCRVHSIFTPQYGHCENCSQFICNTCIVTNPTYDHGVENLLCLECFKLDVY